MNNLFTRLIYINDTLMRGGGHGRRPHRRYEFRLAEKPDISQKKKVCPALLFANHWIESLGFGRPRY